MLIYHIRLALKSLRRNPVLSGLIVGGIGLGIGVSTTFITTHYILSLNPIPHKSEVLHYVQIDNWDPDRGWRDSDPEALPDQLTYRDAMALMESEIPTLRNASFKASLYLHPEAEIGRPYKILARLCFADFFPMFEIPFAYGSGWDRSTDQAGEAVIVIDHETNQKLFGGENSVGRRVRLEEQEFRVVGVLQPWWPRPKYYDPHNGAFEKPEEVYIPFEFVNVFQVRSAGNTSNWKSFDQDIWEEYLDSEAIWIQMWVQLDDPAQREAYLEFLDAHAEGQRQLGRMLRPTSSRLSTVSEWLDDREVVPEEATSLMVISILFLAVCALNLIGVLLGKFLSRAPEVGVRRALGANRRAVFFQHLVECEVVGVLGGLVGIALSIFGLNAINRMFEHEFVFALDGPMVAAAILLSLVAGLVAGVYPAWRICSVPPALYLKEQ